MDSDEGRRGVTQEELDPFANSDEWAVYERVDNDRWEFCALEGGCEGDPGSAARYVAARKWTSGKHTMLAANLAGAFMYEITLDTKGPVVRVADPMTTPQGQEARADADRLGEMRDQLQRRAAAYVAAGVPPDRNGYAQDVAVLNRAIAALTSSHEEGARVRTILADAQREANGECDPSMIAGLLTELDEALRETASDREEPNA